MIPFRLVRDPKTQHFLNMLHMDQRSITLCLAKEHVTPIAIHGDLVEALSPEAAAYSTLTRYLRTGAFGNRAKRKQSKVRRPLSLKSMKYSGSAYCGAFFFGARTSTAHMFVQNHDSSASHPFSEPYSSSSSLDASSSVTQQVGNKGHPLEAPENHARPPRAQRMA